MTDRNQNNGYHWRSQTGESYVLEILEYSIVQEALIVKNTPANAEDSREVSLIPGLGRSPGRGYEIHSSIPAWRIPQTEEPGGLWSTGLQRVGHNWVSNTHSCPETIIMYYSVHFIQNWSTWLLILKGTPASTGETCTGTWFPILNTLFPGIQG